MKQILFICLIVFMSVQAFPQVGIGTSSPNASAALDINASNKGLLIPRVSSAQRKAISNPAAGLLVFDLDMSILYFFDGQQWLPLARTNESLLPPMERFAEDGADGDGFGHTVAISGDYAIAGAPADDIGSNTDQGSAYIFFRNNGSWVQQAKLTASDGAASDFFGFSVAISGNYAVVGAYGDASGANNEVGSAYVFIRNGSTWTQQAKLTASDGAAFDQFGFSVAISGDYIIAGAPRDDIGSVSNQGSAYIFFRNGSTWSQQAKLTAGNISEALSGWSVAIGSEFAVAGAPQHIISGNLKSGAAFVFRRSGSSWSLHSTLNPPAYADGDFFGSSITMDDNMIAIGAEWVTNSQGSVYIFNRFTLIGGNIVWTYQSRISPPETVGNEMYFGSSLSLSGNNLFISARGFKQDNYATGAGFLYVKNGVNWDYRKKINTPLNSTESSIGSAPFRRKCMGAISGSNYIIGWPQSDSKAKGKIAFGFISN